MPHREAALLQMTYLCSILSRIVSFNQIESPSRMILIFVQAPLVWRRWAFQLKSGFLMKGISIPPSTLWFRIEAERRFHGSLAMDASLSARTVSVSVKAANECTASFRAGR